MRSPVSLKYSRMISLCISEIKGHFLLFEGQRYRDRGGAEDQ